MSDQVRTRVVVTVDSNIVDSIDSVADELRREGMQVHQVLPTTGIITGEVHSTDLSRWAAVRGVLAIERDEEMWAM